MDNKYINRFESGRVVTAILVDSDQDAKNKEEIAKAWCGDNPDRAYKFSKENNPYIKLVDGEIVELTLEEIEALKPLPEKTEVEKLIELLDDKDIQDKIKEINPVIVEEPIEEEPI